MRKIARVCATLAVGLGLTVAAASADTVYRSGGSTHDGQTVNSYTNSGAQHLSLIHISEPTRPY